jgi:hypothetical protein
LAARTAEVSAGFASADFAPAALRDLARRRAASFLAEE